MEGHTPLPLVPVSENRGRKSGCRSVRRVFYLAGRILALARKNGKPNRPGGRPGPGLVPARRWVREGPSLAPVEEFLEHVGRRLTRIGLLGGRARWKLAGQLFVGPLGRSRQRIRVGGSLLAICHGRNGVVHAELPRLR